jgi:hypothetical protein
MADENERQGGFFKQLRAVVTAIYDAVMRGGEIQAAGRQGINELGAALKAFPESIQIDEPGAVFNPLYRDIPSASNQGLAEPGAIADGIAPAQHKGGVYGPEHGVFGPEHGVYGRDNGASAGYWAADDGKDAPLPSPSQIGDGKGPQQESRIWRDRIERERPGDQDGDAGSDQNEQDRQRSLPEEQQDKGRGRSR